MNNPNFPKKFEKLGHLKSFDFIKAFALSLLLVLGADSTFADAKSKTYISTQQESPFLEVKNQLFLEGKKLLDVLKEKYFGQTLSTNDNFDKFSIEIQSYGNFVVVYIKDNNNLMIFSIESSKIIYTFNHVSSGGKDSSSLEQKVKIGLDITNNEYIDFGDEGTNHDKQKFLDYIKILLEFLNK